MLLLLLLLSQGGVLVLGQVTSTVPSYYIPNGIFNPQEVSLDLISTRLVSPQGLVTQFALEIETQTIFTTGWLLSGAAWQYAMLNTEGETQQMLSGLDFLFSTQNLATTVARSLFDATRSLLSRLAITIFIFGWDTTINGIIQTANPFVIGDFLFNPGLIILLVGRAIAQVVFFFSAIGPIYLFATEVWPTIPRSGASNRSNTTRLLVEDYAQYGDYYDGYEQEFSYPALYNEWQTLSRSDPLLNQPDLANFLQGTIDAIVNKIK